MIPSRTWFPGTLLDRASWYDNFDTQFQVVAPILGFAPADVTAVTNDNSVMQFLAAADTQLKAYQDAVRTYRILMTEGDVGDPVVAFPSLPTYGTPTGVPRGLFERLDSIVKRARVTPAYTEEIGALLGIIPTSPSRPLPEDLKPVISASTSINDYKFDLNVTRMGMTAFKVQIQRSGAATWQDVAFATSNPAEVTVTPTTPGEPERVLVRAILLDKNQPVGVPSDPTFVTVNP